LHEYYIHTLLVFNYDLIIYNKMENFEQHIRHFLLYEFLLRHKAREAARNINRAIGQRSVSHTTSADWFNRFKRGDYSLEDQPRSGRPVEVDLARLVELVERDPRQTTTCLASELGCCQTTISRHLNQLGYRPKLGAWVPHELTANQRNLRLDICTSLLTKHRTMSWLDNLITGDEKWILYVNHTRKRQWVKSDQRPLPTPKPEIHQKKVMLSVWWGVRGVVYWELLPDNTTVTADVYCAQLEKLSERLSSERPDQQKVYFLHDNARPHIAKSTRAKLLELGWEVLPHPPYSPDLAPTDYYLFRSLSNNLRDSEFDNKADLKQYLEGFFASKPTEFYARGIHSLHTRWQTVIDNDGTYIID